MTEEWLTPPGIILALGGADSFDLDPATPAVQPYPTGADALHPRRQRADAALARARLAEPAL
jgi:hypothetical protein